MSFTREVMVSVDGAPEVPGVLEIEYAEIEYALSEGYTERRHGRYSWTVTARTLLDVGTECLIRLRDDAEGIDVRGVVVRTQMSEIREPEPESVILGIGPLAWAEAL